MNGSLITADMTTHLKIVAVALLAAMSVIWIGISARLAISDVSPSAPRFERPSFVPSTPRTVPQSPAAIV